jgi:hypothetical protein
MHEGLQFTLTVSVVGDCSTRVGSRRPHAVVIDERHSSNHGTLSENEERWLTSRTHVAGFLSKPVSLFQMQCLTGFQSIQVSDTPAS